MPDINGNFLGDQATVLPDNTAAFMHYSDQFAQLQQQKNAEKAAQLKLEKDRTGRLQTAIHSGIYNANYLKNDATNPLVRESMDRAAAKAHEVYRTQGEAAALDAINKSAMDLGAGSEKIAQTNKKMTEDIAHYQVLHPEWDGARASNIAATNTWWKKDKDGKLVHKELNEINPNDDFLGNVRNSEHGADLYSDHASLAETNAMINKEKIENVKKAQTFNDNGSSNALGYSGTTATRITTPEFIDGKWQAVTSHEDYKLPNATTTFLDNKGLNVRVLPKRIFDDYYHSNDGFKANIDKKVNSELSKPVNLDGKGDVNFGPDSDYADMLRQKFTYQYLDDQLKGRYNINSVDDSDEEMRKYRAENLANARLGLSEHRSKMQDLKTNAILDKVNNGTTNEVPDFLGSMNDKYGEDLKGVEVIPGKRKVNHYWPGTPDEPAIPAKVADMRIIPTTADAKDINIISPMANGKRSIPPRAFNDADGKPLLREDGSQVMGWAVDPTTGNAIGKNGATIDRESTQRNFINHTKKAALPSNNKNAATQKANSKIKGISEGGLN